MREILFRGKRKNISAWANGYKDEWAEGYLFELNDGQFMIYEPYPYASSSLPWDICKSYSFEVIPETIGQYTGLIDKNGVKIFEGDILHCVATFDNGNMVVIYEDGEFHMVLCEKYKTYISLCGYFCIGCFTKEVIGNIHDNPELLKVED